MKTNNTQTRDLLRGPCFRANLRSLVNYFKSGEKQGAMKNLLGLEVEHFVLHKDTRRPVDYEADGESIGVKDILNYLTEFYPKRTVSPRGDLLGCAAEDGDISLEPAGQLEISVAPYSRIDAIKRAYQRFRDALEPLLRRYALELASFGYHPSRKALEMSLIPKERYYCMDRYFSQIGTRGVRMMRGSASTQISIDYRDEEDAVRKMRIAAALGPILAVITDNAPAFEGEANTKPIQRFKLWRDVDDARCKIVPGTFAKGFGYRAYAKWLLGVTPIFVERIDNKESSKVEWVDGKPAAEIYKNHVMNIREIEHLQSMVWPDVRLKKFVEVRPADSLPAPLSFGYAALIKGLFYSEENLDHIEILLGVHDDVWPFDENDVEQLIPKIDHDHYDAELFGTDLRNWIDRLFSMAERALPRSEVHYLAPLKNFATHKPYGAA